MEKEQVKQYILENRNKIKICPFCNSRIEDRVISLYSGLIEALYKIFKWCQEKRRHEFETKEIKHFLGRSEYARFGDLVRFGGLVYKPTTEKRKAFFGLNMERCEKFFKGDYSIPAQLVINQITNEVEAESYVKIHDFKKLPLYKFLKEHGLFDDKKVQDIGVGKDKPTVAEHMEGQLF